MSAALKRQLRSILGSGILGVRTTNNGELNRTGLIDEMAKDPRINSALTDLYGKLENACPDRDNCYTKNNPAVGDFWYVVKNWSTAADDHKKAVQQFVQTMLLSAPYSKLTKSGRTNAMNLRRKFGIPTPAEFKESKPAQGGQSYIGQPTPSDTVMRHETEKKGDAIVPSNLSEEQGKGLLELKSHPDALMSNQSLPIEVSIHESSVDPTYSPGGAMNHMTNIQGTTAEEGTKLMEKYPTKGASGYKPATMDNKLGKVATYDKKMQPLSVPYANTTTKTKSREDSMVEAADSQVSTTTGTYTAAGQQQLNVTSYLTNQQGTGGKTTMGGVPNMEPLMDTSGAETMTTNPSGQQTTGDMVAIETGGWGKTAAAAVAIAASDPSVITDIMETMKGLIDTGATESIKIIDDVISVLKDAVKTGQKLSKTILDKAQTVWSKLSPDKQEQINELTQRTTGTSFTELVSHVTAGSGRKPMKLQQLGFWSEREEGARPLFKPGNHVSTPGVLAETGAEVGGWVRNPKRKGYLINTVTKEEKLESAFEEPEDMPFDAEDAFMVSEETGGTILDRQTQQAIWAYIGEQKHMTKEQWKHSSAELRKKYIKQWWANRRGPYTTSSKNKREIGRKIKMYVNPKSKDVSLLLGEPKDPVTEVIQGEKALQNSRASFKSLEKDLAKAKGQREKQQDLVRRAYRARYRITHPSRGTTQEEIPEQVIDKILEVLTRPEEEDTTYEEPIGPSAIPEQPTQSTTSTQPTMPIRILPPIVINGDGQTPPTPSVNTSSSSIGSSAQQQSSEPVSNIPSQASQQDIQAKAIEKIKQDTAIKIAKLEADNQQSLMRIAAQDRRQKELIDHLRELELQRDREIEVKDSKHQRETQNQITELHQNIYNYQQDINQLNDIIAEQSNQIAALHKQQDKWIQQETQLGNQDKQSDVSMLPATATGRRRGNGGGNGGAGGAAQEDEPMAPVSTVGRGERGGLANLGRPSSDAPMAPISQAGEPMDVRGSDIVMGTNGTGRVRMEDEDVDYDRVRYGLPVGFDPTKLIEQPSAPSSGLPQVYTPFLRLEMPEGNANMVLAVNNSKEAQEINRYGWQEFNNYQWEANEEIDNPLHAHNIIDESRRFYDPLDKEEFIKDQAQAATEETYNMTNDVFVIPKRALLDGESIVYDTRGDGNLRPYSEDETDTVFHDTYLPPWTEIPETSAWNQFTAVEGSQIYDSMLADPDRFTARDNPLLRFQNNFIASTLS